MHHPALTHCCTVGSQPCILTAMPSIVQQPRERPLHHPARGDDRQACAGMLYDLYVDLGLAGAGPCRGLGEPSLAAALALPPLWQHAFPPPARRQRRQEPYPVSQGPKSLGSIRH